MRHCGRHQAPHRVRMAPGGSKPGISGRLSATTCAPGGLRAVAAADRRARARSAAQRRRLDPSRPALVRRRRPRCPDRRRARAGRAGQRGHQGHHAGAAPAAGRRRAAPAGAAGVTEDGAAAGGVALGAAARAGPARSRPALAVDQSMKKKALQPVELQGLEGGAAGRIRTHDPLVRSQVLYPTELQPREAVKYTPEFW